jgi:hypothetical protein
LYLFNSALVSIFVIWERCSSDFVEETVAEFRNPLKGQAGDVRVNTAELDKVQVLREAVLF